jgi:hypothetical protein
MEYIGGRPDRRSSAGQSLVEFTLVLPLMLLLLITAADFGRFFAAGITIESAARTAAEIAASDYLTESIRSGGAINTAGYDRIHAAAWRSVCDEASLLPGTVAGTGGGECTGLPTVVCVHDGQDPQCGEQYNEAGYSAAECPAVLGPAPLNTQTGGTETSRYVEVRVCYRFFTIFRLAIPSLGGVLAPLSGEFTIERDRTFAVMEY